MGNLCFFVSPSILVNTFMADIRHLFEFCTPRDLFRAVVFSKPFINVCFYLLSKICFLCLVRCLSLHLR